MKRERYREERDRGKGRDLKGKGEKKGREGVR